MRTECVTKVWEFYRDNCDGYKEPMRKQLCELDEHVDHIAAENAKLRELCGFMLRCMKRNHDCDCCLVNGEHCEISYIESDARELGVVE